ncbi:MAG: GDP-mannose 4,6-dehydratase [Acidobacteria bacterium]|nr:GDP-mannose 4,6-dehydratase [Acidobacteriota bacterium]
MPTITPNTAAEPTSETTLITGAAGFAGRHLLAHLQADAAAGPLLAWSRRPQPNEAGVAWRVVDVTDKEAVDRAIAEARPTRIAHLAGSPHVGQSWKNSMAPLRTNVMGTHHILEAVRQHCPSCRVLVVTSAMIYHASDTPLTEDAPLVPTNPYGLAKLAQDQLALLAAETDHLDVVIARPFNHVGPGQDPSFALSSFARQIARIEHGLTPAEVRVGNLDAERDLTDVRDTVRAYAQLLDTGQSGRAYNICTGLAVRIGDLLDQLIALARAPVTRAVDPARLRPSDLPRLVGDASRLRAEVGWLPQRAIADTLGDTLDWWREEVAAGRDVR